jgi:two-component system phosphate regulon sensor histidine kinase PhoR
MIHKPRTLLWQLGLGLMGAQAVAVLLLGWYAIAQFGAFNRRQTVAELERATPLLAERYGDLLSNGSPDALDAIVKSDSQDDVLRVTVILPDGTVVADSDAPPSSMENHLLRPEVAAALRGASGTNVRRSATTQQQTTYFAWPVLRDGQVKAIVRTALPLEAVSDEPGRVIRIVGLAALLSMGVTFLLFYFVSRRLSRSFQRVGDGAARFASGDLSHRIARPASRELAALAESLNNMAERLADQIDLLQTQRSEQQAIHQSMSNALIALDLEQRILSANRAAERLLGIDSDGVRGRLLQEVLREPELHRFVAEAFTDGQSVGEFQLRNGPAPRVQAVSEPLRNAREQLV